MTRIAFIHTGSVVIPVFQALARELLPGVDLQNLLDDRIVTDLGAGQIDGVRRRLSALGETAAAAGATRIMLTCSSISGFADDISLAAGVPVLRVDEAMADLAVSSGGRIGVVATLPTTLAPTAALIEERARTAGAEPDITPVLVDGAFDAVSTGDRARHDALVADALIAIAPHVDVIVLAQASMAGAAEGADVDRPILTSPRSGVERLAAAL